MIKKFNEYSVNESKKKKVKKKMSDIEEYQSRYGKFKISDDEVNFLHSEFKRCGGFGNCVFNSGPLDEIIKDEEFNKLWNKSREALEKLDDYLLTQDVVTDLNDLDNI